VQSVNLRMNIASEEVCFSAVVLHCPPATGGVSDDVLCAVEEYG
jgi:hypothetical protein